MPFAALPPVSEQRSCSSGGSWIFRIFYPEYYENAACRCAETSRPFIFTPEQRWAHGQRKRFNEKACVAKKAKKSRKIMMLFKASLDTAIQAGA